MRNTLVLFTALLLCMQVYGTLSLEECPEESILRPRMFVRVPSSLDDAMRTGDSRSAVHDQLTSLFNQSGRPGDEEMGDGYYFDRQGRCDPCDPTCIAFIGSLAYGIVKLTLGLVL